jgi:hypothetical protein
LAPRALAQKGFSLIGAESPYLIQAMIQHNAIEILVFRRGTRPALDNSLAKDLLVPPRDEMTTLFDECKSEGGWSMALDWLNQNYPTINPPAADTDRQHMFA